MMMMRPTIAASLVLTGILGAAMGTRAGQHAESGQPGSPAAPPAQLPAGGGLGLGAPRHEEDKAAVERGRAAFGLSCGFCHGSDARGGSTGPNLWRSAVVLMDKKGESIGKVILEGRPDKGMPPMALPEAQIADIAAFLRSLPASGRDPARMRPPTIVVGDAAEGEKYFQATCASCHSVTGDLRGLAAKYPDPRQLQHAWLMPGSQRGGPPPPQPEVHVTLGSGQTVVGTLARIDDFIVSLVDASGETHTFRRTPAGPRVDIRDPLEPHRRLVPTYTDPDIHNLTAYLVTLK